MRIALFLADSERYGAGHRRFMSAIGQALDVFGVPESQAVATAYLDYLDGLILHLVTVRPGVGPSVGEVAAVLTRLAGR